MFIFIISNSNMCRVPSQPLVCEICDFYKTMINNLERHMVEHRVDLLSLGPMLGNENKKMHSL